MRRYGKWFNNPDLDLELKKELELICNNAKEIEDRFYADLSFGTGGLRGLIGVGTNRMNIYTIRKATQGVANYIKKIAGNNQSVVIAYDVRKKSREFAEQAALVFANNKIKANIFEDIMPTPILSYAVRELGATAGIVITASHNPKEYNGYKVYWSDGGQITDKIANEITKEIEKVENELLVEIMDRETAEEKELLNWLDDEILNSYLKKVNGLVLRPDIIKKVSDEFKIVYTPLHGTGNTAVTRLLKEVGFTNVMIVPEQAQPDPSFSTVKYPNPEEHAAFKLALDLAGEIDADIAMATDPDADRVGVAVKDETGKYVILSGNQLGALMIDYILRMKKHNNSIPDDAVIIKTIVTSSMGVNIAAKYGVKYMDVLTGFKYIGEKIKEFHRNKSHTFIFSYEESYGYLIGDFVRDKDAVQSCLLAAEMAAYYKSLGITLYERLQQLFEEYGYYKEDLVSLNLSGIKGQERIKRIMETIRKQQISYINYKNVVLIKDYLSGTEHNLKAMTKYKINGMPSSNVIHYTLEDKSWFCVRPSGTEPKLKIYFSVIGESKTEADEKLMGLKEAVLQVIEGIK
jgi:phosphoglucomutase